MREIDGQEHLEAFEVERIAVSASAETLQHLLQCQRCARLVLHYAETRETTPFEQLPREE